ncbi:MAG: 1-deoxy-D-xylulose-5-phosphate synthase [Fusobacteriaceae bacterium]
MKKLKEMNIEQLNERAKEIRELLIKTVSKNGGHLAPNLGIVELTMAIHRVFNSPEDKIIFDVGHQSYVHKILTDREDRFSTIRKRNGLSPFSDPEESIHDQFISGHAGTALSAACGIAKTTESKVIVVIGDASICNGHSMEALNNMNREESKNIIVILNNNEMSIGKNIGTFSNFLSKVMTSNIYKGVKRDIRSIIKTINDGNFGQKLTSTLERAEISVKQFLSPLSISESFGFNFYGTIDGHDFVELENCLKKAKQEDGPTFIHVKTQKGKGYSFAEKDCEKFHGISPFDLKTGLTQASGVSYSSVFGEKILEMAEKDKNIHGISAAMVKGVGLGSFFKEFPNRSKDVGICEGHAITYAAGLAMGGKNPYLALYSTFLQRGVSQLIHDVALQKLSIKFIIDRAGIVGEDGKTHNGIYDVALFLTVPNFMIFSPTTLEELKEILDETKDVQKQSVVIRYPREIAYKYELPNKFVIGKWQEVEKGNDVLLVATGTMFEEVMKIKDLLKEKKINATIVSAASIKPLDTDYIKNNFMKYKDIFVLEENYKVNSFGSSIVNHLNDIGVNKKINIIAIENYRIPHGSRDILMKELGLRGENLLKKIEGSING